MEELIRQVEDQVRAIKTWALVLEVSVVLLVLLVATSTLILGATLFRISRRLEEMAKTDLKRGISDATVHYDAATVAYHRQQEALKCWYDHNPPSPPQNVVSYGRS